MTRLIFILTVTLITVSACSRKDPDKGSIVSADPQKAPCNLVWVEGGSFKNTKSTNYYGKDVTISSFYIGKYEVTQNEWAEIMKSDPAQFKGDNLPVEMVSWYECIDYCNQRSVKEGLRPYYNIDKQKKDLNNENGDDEVKWTVSINAGANGYRLPTEAEWEYAAGGGQLSKSYVYSGNDDVNKVAWYWRNSGNTNLTGFWYWPVIEENHCKTKPVGLKDPNELGLYDMAGNVREFCWDWYAELPSLGSNPQGRAGGFLRTWKGGGWIGGDFCCESSFRAGYEQYQKGPDQGFRVCRGK